MSADDRSYSDLLQWLQGQRSLSIVGVDGGGGGGKSTFARALERVSPSDVTVVEIDDFYRPSGERLEGPGRDKPIGSDFDWERLRDQVLIPLAENRSASYQRYDWDDDELAEWHQVDPPGVIVIEGVYTTRNELRNYYDLRVWVDTPKETRLARGLQRDGEEARAAWEEDWMPAEERYAAEHRPRESAHLVVSGAGDGDARADAFSVIEDRRDH